MIFFYFFYDLFINALKFTLLDPVTGALVDPESALTYMYI